MGGRVPLGKNVEADFPLREMHTIQHHPSSLRDAAANKNNGRICWRDFSVLAKERG